MANQAPPSRPVSAFSLPEVVMVVFLMAVAAALAMPRYTNSLNVYRANLAARRVAADLALARQAAWASGSRRIVTFTPSSGQYRVEGVGGLDNPASAYVVSLPAGPYRATLHSVNFAGEANVAFDGYGFPNRGGTIVVQAGSQRRTVLLDANTGSAIVP